MHVALPRSRGSEKRSPADQTLGFLAAGRDPTFGYVGGYLLTTARGRPLEFHYTTPVKPSATHRILYGAELEPYIFGELIAANLVRQSTIEPAFLITDQPLVLNQRAASSCPIVCVLAAKAISDGATATDTAAPELSTHADFGQDLDALNVWQREAESEVNLCEPFVRIWEALREVLSGDAKQAAA
jgi:hypothetical protein